MLTSSVATKNGVGEADVTFAFCHLLLKSLLQHITASRISLWELDEIFYRFPVTTNLNSIIFEAIATDIIVPTTYPRGVGLINSLSLNLFETT